VETATEEWQKLVEDNMRLVYHLANKYRSFLDGCAAYGFEDLVAEGFKALVMAAKKFDKNRGVSFATFACSYIDGYMKKFVNHEAMILNFGRRVSDNFMKINKSGLIEESTKTITDALHMTEKEVNAAKQYHANKISMSLNEYVFDDSSKETQERFLGYEAYLDERCIVNEIFDLLNEKEQTILMKAMCGYSRRKIGADFGVSGTQATNIIRKIGMKVRRYYERAAG